MSLFTRLSQLLKSHQFVTDGFFIYICIYKLKIKYMSKVVKLTDKNLEETLKLEQPILVDFWAEWCNPCKMMGIVIDELAEDYDGKVVIGKVDADENSELTKKYSIRSIPTILIFKNGEVVDKKIGVVSKQELMDIIDNYL